MNANENTRNDTTEDIIVLGVASVETKGDLIGVEFMGDDPGQGISDQ